MFSQQTIQQYHVKFTILIIRVNYSGMIVLWLKRLHLVVVELFHTTYTMEMVQWQMELVSNTTKTLTAIN